MTFSPLCGEESEQRFANNSVPVQTPQRGLYRYILERRGCMETLLSQRVTRVLLTLASTIMVMISTAGCSSASSSHTLAPTATQTPAAPRAPRVGDVAPDFALDTLDGTRKVRLSDFSSQAVLLDFWAVTCSACVKEQSAIQRFALQQQAASKPMVVIGVDLDQVTDFVKVAALQQRLHLTYVILVDDHFQARSRYQISDVPVAYFLDRQHVIRALVTGPLDEAALHKEVSSVER
jgi:peroxiredoxin